MAWIEIVPTASTATKPSPAVMKIAAGRPRMGRRLVISVRVQEIDGLSWWLHDSRVKVQYGEGDHLGYIRVSAGGPFKLTTTGPRERQGAAVTLFLPCPPIVAAVIAETSRTPVEYGLDGKAIWFKMPKEWRHGQAPSVAQGPQPAALKQPFRTAATNGTAPRPLAGGR